MPEEIAKTQAIRLADVFIIGPVMIYAALGQRPPKALRAALLVFGVLTIWYNTRNYLRNQETVMLISS